LIGKLLSRTPVRSASRTSAVLGLCLCVSTAARAGSAPDAAAILDRAERVRSPELDYAVDFTIRVVDPKSVWKERSAAYTLIASGKDRSLVLMREPSQFYPGILLIDEGVHWLLLPKSDRPLQLAPRQVLSGDVSTGDLARGNLLGQYHPALAGEAVIEGQDCWGLELARSGTLAMYPRIRAWITKEHYRPWRFEYFGETEELSRVVDFRDYRDTPIGVRSLRIEIDNRLSPGERSTLVFTNMRKIATAKLPFTPDGLALLRAAALLELEHDRTPILPEELPAYLERVRNGETPRVLEGAAPR
jgi:hypothetical protein